MMHHTTCENPIQYEALAVGITLQSGPTAKQKNTACQCRIFDQSCYSSPSEVMFG